MKIGSGYDIHRLIEGRKLILGGVEIPYIKGLIGHSDADVILHSLADAMLGGLALGDIGVHFPNTDSAYKDSRSIDLLKKVNDMITEKGYIVNNADITVVAEDPKISPFVEKMRKNISDALKIDISSVSVKATTNEGVGSMGRGEAIASYAVVTLSRR